MSVADIEVNYLVHEDVVARQDRIIHKLLKIILVEGILAILIIAGMAVGFGLYESQFTTESIVVSQEAETLEGSNTLINNSGGLIYGKDETDSKGYEESP